VASPDRAVEFAARAVRAYNAMERAFRREDGMYRRDGLAARFGAVAHLWPFARALVATLDLAGIERDVLPALHPGAAIGRMLAVLERYWNARPGALAAYASDPPGGSRFGGDRYYDDNAWVALALIQRHRLAAGVVEPGDLARVGQLWEFAQAGWDRSGEAPSGGVFWVEQGHGIGRRNHDRNAVSSAPNAQVGLHLADLGISTASTVAPEEMFGWVVEHLDAGGDGLGPFYDKLRGDGTLDTKVWTYNHGSMIGASVLLARRAAATGHHRAAAEWTDRAEAMARRSLQHFAGAGLRGQPAEFNAIYFRNLLLLHRASTDQPLRAELTATILAYADWLWHSCRAGEDRFRFKRRGFTLLGQSAVVQIFALLAWDPDAYGLIA
jgi:hypothetical protein